MINIKELETTDYFIKAIPAMGYYKRRLPIMIRQFADQEFTNLHVIAVVCEEKKCKTENELRKVVHSVKSTFTWLEKTGYIERTGRTTTNGAIIYTATNNEH